MLGPRFWSVTPALWPPHLPCKLRKAVHVQHRRCQASCLPTGCELAAVWQRGHGFEAGKASVSHHHGTGNVGQQPAHDGGWSHRRSKSCHVIRSWRSPRSSSPRADLCQDAAFPQSQGVGGTGFPLTPHQDGFSTVASMPTLTPPVGKRRETPFTKAREHQEEMSPATNC